MKKNLTLGLCALLAGQLCSQEIIPQNMKAISNPSELEITVMNDFNKSKNAKPMVKMADGTLLFSAIAVATGEELYISKNDQIQILKDIVPDKTGSNPQWMTVVGDKVYFTATTPDAGQELWITDGTPAGTKLVKDIYEGTTGSNLFGLTSFNGKCLFFAMDIDSELDPVIDSQTAEQWLWSSDGTEAGTMRIANVPTRRGIDGPHGYVVPSGNLAFFIGYDRVFNETLWTTDGTSAGTKVVKDIYPVPSTGSTFTTQAATIDWLTSIKNNENEKRVVFRANTLDGNGAKIGSEIWYSDGTDAGTKWVGKDFNPGEQDGVANNTEFAFPVYYNGKVYFRGKDGIHGCEPGVTDFTAEGTHLVSDINFWNNQPEQDSWGPEYSYVWNGYLFCQANGSFYYPEGEYHDSGFCLWSYNLSEGGVTPTAENGLKGYQYQSNWTGGVEIYPGNNSDNPRNFATCGGRLYFAAQDKGSNLELWMMETVDATPVKISDLEGNSFPHSLTDVNNSLYFITTTTKTLYKYSAEPTGVENIKMNTFTIYPNPAVDVVEISSPNEISEVKIFTLNGQQIMSISGNQNKINVSNLKSGAYIVSMKDITGTISTKKLIK